MSLGSWLARVFGRKQADVTLVAAVADDGSGSSPSVGDLSPLRAFPGSGAVLVRDNAPATTPLLARVAVAGTAVQLSTATPDGGSMSLSEWRVVVPAGGAGVRIGKSDVTAADKGFEVAAGTDGDVPSSALAGWYAISTTGASVTIDLVGSA